MVTYCIAGFFGMAVLVFFLPVRLKLSFSLALSLGLAFFTGWPALSVLFSGQAQSWEMGFFMWEGPWRLRMDSLSAFFSLIIHFSTLLAFLFSRSYLRPYLATTEETGGPVPAWGLHFFSMLLLQASMLLVVLFQDGLPFLIAWEGMTVSSFFLILFEGHKAETRKAAIQYLVQMHLGFLFLMIAFVYVDWVTGSMDFESIGVFFSQYRNLGLFLLFFVGFGMKAGFIPFHSWLPNAHPAAPSHVSGLMSGVMIKMGIFGILRIMTLMQQDFLEVGLILFGLGLLGSVLGIIFAILQRDMKKLLAYSSIENIGIIGLGLGMGFIGMSLNFPLLALMGFLGALLHVLNHSLFKPLLFFSSGLVYIATHTRNMEQLGGLIHGLPRTALLFLAGSMAICGLPPVNGFVSEMILFLGLYEGLHSGNFYFLMLFLAGIVGLALTGGLALMAFTKIFGVVFLGHPRSESAARATEPPGFHFPALLIPVGLMLLIGIFPMLLIHPLKSIVIEQFPNLEVPMGNTLSGLFVMGGFMGIFLLMVVGLWILRMRYSRRHPQSIGPVWGCGYTGNTSKMQYSGISFVQDFLQLSHPLTRFCRLMKPFGAEEIFPGPRDFRTESQDPLAAQGIDRPATFLQRSLKKAAVLQTGQIQHYILYAFLFMILVFVLSILNIL
jgi:hydrogenase-4 component B